jgi:PIN domain nuclease of toxin-antitoxin system
VKVLLDTHVWLRQAASTVLLDFGQRWPPGAGGGLAALLRFLGSNMATEVSLATLAADTGGAGGGSGALRLWEIAIKHALARSAMPLSAHEAIPWAEQSGFAFLPIELPHLLVLEQLPLHHRDPFDRLLVAQAISGPFTLLSADAAFTAYGCPQQDARS